MQPQYNLVYREEEREMLPLCADQGVGVIPWSPLARGFLAGGRGSPGEGNTERARTDEFAPRLYYREPDYKVLEALEAIARARGVSNMQIALAWVLRNPGVTSPIVGASKLHHLGDAIAALEISLTDDEVGALEAPYRPKLVLDHQ
jgi:aryl-alcohol dehydrogenase (NADP+)